MTTLEEHNLDAGKDVAQEAIGMLRIITQRNIQHGIHMCGFQKGISLS